MGKKYIIIPDPHAHADHNNDRADWLAQLIIDEKPDVVVNLGDQYDMPSLSSYDKGKRDFQGKSYKKDIDAGREFSERLWEPVKARKKKMPHTIVLEGNHEHRIERGLDLSPELSGTIGFKDYGFEDYYDEIIRYEGGTPGVIELDGILFAHYFITGVSGRPISGERPAHMLIDKTGTSCIAGHLHTLDYATRTNVAGVTRSGLIAGCFHDYIPDWAGHIGNLWRPGVAILNDVENGNYDLEWVSIKRLKEAYGS
jgi:hypothetical protein